MTHGKRHPAIRSPHTVTALRAIGRAGLLPLDEADTLAGHYRFLRRVSARPAPLRRPAHRHPGPGRAHSRAPCKSLEYPSRKEFLEDYKRRTSWVRALYDRVVPA